MLFFVHFLHKTATGQRALCLQYLLVDDTLMLSLSVGVSVSWSSDDGDEGPARATAVPPALPPLPDKFAKLSGCSSGMWSTPSDSPSNSPLPTPPLPEAFKRCLTDPRVNVPFPVTMPVTMPVARVLELEPDTATGTDLVDMGVGAGSGATTALASDGDGIGIGGAASKLAVEDVF